MDANKQRALQLRKIDLSMQLARRGGRPGAGRAALMAAGAMALVELARYALRVADLLEVPWWASFVAFAVVYGFVLRHAPHKSYTALICDQLLRYEPLNVRAYQLLQEDTAAHGLRREAVEEWLSAEWDAVQPPEVPAEQKRFVNKQIGPRLVGKDK